MADRESAEGRAIRPCKSCITLHLWKSMKVKRDKCVMGLFLNIKIFKQPYQLKGLVESSQLIWLFIGLSLKIPEIPSRPVLP